jgi:hypothetical protein
LQRLRYIRNSSRFHIGCVYSGDGSGNARFALSGVADDHDLIENRGALLEREGDRDRSAISYVHDYGHRPIADPARANSARSRRNADNREGSVITRDSAESGPFDYDIDAGERLSGRAVDHLTGNRTGRLLRAEGSAKCCGAKSGTA